MTPEEIALRRPQDYIYYGHLPLYTRWGSLPASDNRDAEPRIKVNHSALVDWMTRTFGPPADDDPSKGVWDVVNSNHWAVGWVENIVFEVYTPTGEVSPVFLALVARYPHIFRRKEPC